MTEITEQSDRQSGRYSIRELERIRDDNLVGILRALKARDWGAGTVLNRQDKRLKPEVQIDFSKPLLTLSRTVPIDWTDYNGHMNESRYAQAFSDASNTVMETIGADQGYVAAGFSYFTVESSIRFLNEVRAGEAIAIKSYVREGQGKKLGIFSQMFHSDGRLLASCNQLLVHVDLKTRRACVPSGSVAARLSEIVAAHARLSIPDTHGETS